MSDDYFSTKTLADEMPRFTNLKKLGGGGFGEVFRARDLSTQHDVALKIALGEFPRFQREFNILATSGCRNLVHVYELGSPTLLSCNRGTSDFHLWYTMELCDTSLTTVIGTMSIHQRLDVALQLLDGLAYLEQRKIAHRDIKPANIFIASDSTAKIGDFGIARATDKNGDYATSITGRGVAGTLEYVAPERFSEPDSAMLIASDQYAAGIVIYQLLAASSDKWPLEFGNKSIAAIVTAHRESDVKPAALREHPKADFPRIDSVIRRMLAKDPFDRFPTISRCKAALQIAIDASGII